MVHTLMSAADDPTAAASPCAASSVRASAVLSTPACLLTMGSSEVEPGKAARSARRLATAAARAAARGSGVWGSKGSRAGAVRSGPAWFPPMRISDVSPGAAPRRRAFALAGSSRGSGRGTTCCATAAAMAVRSRPACRPPTRISDVEPGSAARACDGVAARLAGAVGEAGVGAGVGSATRVC